MSELATKFSLRPGIDLLAHAVKANPFPTYKLMREQYPVCLVEPGNMWAISRMDDVKFALKRHDLFSSSGFKVMFEPEWLREDCRRDPFIITQDPPLHTKNRAVVNKAFISRIIQALVPLMKRIAVDLCSGVTKGRETDFMDAFAFPYVAGIIAHITGTSGNQSANELRAWFELMETVTPIRPSDEIVAAIEAGNRTQIRYFNDVIRARKANPSGDLISALVMAEVDGVRLDDRSLRDCIDLIIGAGLGTTSHTLCNAVIQLSRRPQLFKQLKSDPALIPAFIEEMLRYDPATHCLLRLTTTDVEIAGTVIPKDALVLVMLGAANRDPAYFERPDEFDMGRKNNREHVAFGHGAHTCIGLALARLELKIALETILEHFDGFTCPDSESMQWLCSLPTHGVSALPLAIY